MLLLLKSLIGLRIRIELKNDAVLEGVVQEVGQDMDVTLLNACEIQPNVSDKRQPMVVAMAMLLLLLLLLLCRVAAVHALFSLLTHRYSFVSFCWCLLS